MYFANFATLTDLMMVSNCVSVKFRSFTADGVPVLMHDETLDRTTNGSGPVSKVQFVQLKRLDAAAHHRLKYVHDQTLTWFKAFMKKLSVITH